MDTTTYINRLRAQFLWDCPEKEQMKRMIKPYIPVQDTSTTNDVNDKLLNAKISKIFTTPDGHNILPELESPPISESFMENYTSTSRPKMAKDRHISRTNAFMKNDSDTENHDQSDEASQKYVVGNPLISEEEYRKITDTPSMKDNALSPMSNLTNNVHRKSSNSLEYNSSDSDIEEIKKKSTRKLPFSRIFKGKRDSTDSHDKTYGRRKSDFHKKEKNVGFDMNFDYDEDLEEDDEDEDDEDEGEDLHSRFFHPGSEANKSSTANGAGDTDNQFNRASSNNSLGVNSNVNNGNGSTTVTLNNNRKSHFPQNMIPRAPLLDGGKNSSFRSDRLLKGGGHEDQTSTGHPEKKNVAEVDDYSSDLDSYINEQDLDNLNLDADIPSRAKSNSSKPNLSSTVAGDGQEEEGMLLSDSHDTDSGSSYGKSLLDSDFSGDEFMKPDESAIDSMSLLNDSDLQPDTVSHSIPMTLDEYGIYHGQDDSTLNNVFDKAVLNIKASKPHLRERRSSGHLIPHSISSRRFSTSSNIGGKSKYHTRSLSATSTDSGKLKGDYSKRHASGNEARQSKLSLPSGICHSRSSSKGDSFAIHKISNFQKPQTTDSLLSSLFNRKKQSDGNAADMLEYFSFVSGNKVPAYEATTLNIYIQASKKYKHKPFKVNVRKSATVFETIGYVLYLFATDFKPENFEEDGLSQEEMQNPNKFCLKIVDEDGEPFEDDFGKLDRKKLVQLLSDDEVVLCRVSSTEEEENEKQTPLPYNLNGEIIGGSQPRDSNTGGLNQLSYYKPIVGNDASKEVINDSKVAGIKVFKYPCINKTFNYTTVDVSMTSSLNDILVKYCKMKNIDPNEYVLKAPDKKLTLNLNDTVLGLDGHYEVEIVSKKEARELQLKKSRPDSGKPDLPTIQSTDLTPLTLEPTSAYLKPQKIEQRPVKETKVPSKIKKLGSKHKLMLATQNSSSSNVSGSANVNGFFKSKNSSKTSLHGSYYTPDRSTPTVGGATTSSGGNNYQDLFSGAYHKYKVWRRQQMSLMNKHERALALDGDYIYIVPPEKHLHWHENVKTKSIHISQVTLVKKSKRVPEYFKLFIQRGQHDIKRYYFEAVSPQECTEIVSRIQNSLSAYRMNHK